MKAISKLMVAKEAKEAVLMNRGIASGLISDIISFKLIKAKTKTALHEFIFAGTVEENITDTEYCHKLTAHQYDKDTMKTFINTYQKWYERHVINGKLMSAKEVVALNKAMAKEAEIKEEADMKNKGYFKLAGTAYEIVNYALDYIRNIAELKAIDSKVSGIMMFHAEMIEAMEASKREEVKAKLIGDSSALLPIEAVEAKLERISISKKKTVKHGGDIVTDK